MSDNYYLVYQGVNQYQILSKGINRLQGTYTGLSSSLQGRAETNGCMAGQLTGDSGIWSIIDATRHARVKYVGCFFYLISW